MNHSLGAIYSFTLFKTSPHNDSILVYQPKDRARAQEFKAQLNARFKIKEIGPLKWFLRIRVIRDRTAYKAWLCQDVYIEELV